MIAVVLAAASAQAQVTRLGAEAAVAAPGALAATAAVPALAPAAPLGAGALPVAASLTLSLAPSVLGAAPAAVSAAPLGAGEVAAAPALVRGAARRDALWLERILPSAYAALPRSRGLWRRALATARALLTLGKTFDADTDELPPGHEEFKLFHPFGSTAKFQYRSRGGHPFTGVLADQDVPGLMRLSLGAPEKAGSFAPGVGLKFFIDGASSLNAVLLGPGGLEGHGTDKNFVLGRFTNDVPKPRGLVLRIITYLIGLFNHGNALFIPADHLAYRHADGTWADVPSAPYELVLQAVAGLATPSDTKEAFQTELAALPLGWIFEVYASAAPGTPLIPVGDIEMTTPLVPSEYGDKSLFFRHRRGDP